MKSTIKSARGTSPATAQQPVFGQGAKACMMGVYRYFSIHQSMGAFLSLRKEFS